MSASGTSEMRIIAWICDRRRALVMVCLRVFPSRVVLQHTAGTEKMIVGLAAHGLTTSEDIGVQFIDRMGDVIFVQFAFRGVDVRVVVQGSIASVSSIFCAFVVLRKSAARERERAVKLHQMCRLVDQWLRTR